MQQVQFITPLHISSKRDYLARMNAEKPANMRVAKQFNADYWDGDRKFGYGGFKYDGRYKSVAEAMVKHYGLKPNDKVFDIGCGKGFLAYEFKLHGLEAYGCDISAYALAQAANILTNIALMKAQDLMFYADESFDFVYSVNTLHNLNYADLKQAIREMVRVSRDKMYICVESYRTEEELCNLQCWALTCASFYTPDDWLQIYEDCGYKGDYEFIFFT